MTVRDTISSVIFYVGVVAAAWLLIWLGSTYGFEKVPQEFRGMEPHLDRGSHAFVRKGIRNVEEDLRYKDVIVYRRPGKKHASYDYELAHVVGKPGDVVDMEGRKLFRCQRSKDGLGPREPVEMCRYADERGLIRDFSPFIVPRNTVFVMHDNQDTSEPLGNLVVPVHAIYARLLR
jgi:signal peptidase I